MSEDRTSRFPHSQHAGDVVGTYRPGCPDCALPLAALAAVWDTAYDRGYEDATASAKPTRPNPYRSYR